MIAENLLGQKFHRLTVEAVGERTGGKKPKLRWVVKCDCGELRLAATDQLKGGRMKSCGCLRRDRTIARNTTHGQSGSVEYKAYKAAKQRCNNPNDEHYAGYGARGIQFRFTNFSTFLTTVGERPSRRYSLGRIDNNGHYEAGNVRWETPAQQNRNKERTVLVTHDGETLSLAEWAERKSLRYGLLYSRLKAGWSTERALMTQSQKAHTPHSRHCRKGTALW